MIEANQRSISDIEMKDEKIQTFYFNVIVLNPLIRYSTNRIYMKALS